MKNILISTFDMSIGGVERSLISLLEYFDYSRYQLDLMLFRHQGDYLPILPEGSDLLEEIPAYSTFRKSILEIIKEGHFLIAITRLIAKYYVLLLSVFKKINEPGTLQIQLGYRLALPFLPRLYRKYDVAVSYLWPHYFISEKVNAKSKIAWVHTDYTKLEINNKVDEKMWEKFDRIIAVSDSCREAFLKRYPNLEPRTIVIENIASPDFIKGMAEEGGADEMQRSTSSVKIVTVARITRAKGIDIAIEACRRLLNKGYDIIWYVVGFGGDEGYIKNLIEQFDVKNNFILLGKKINPYPYMKECDIYCQPSRYEGKAVTVREAQILGKPVVITDFPTSSSQLDNNVDGYICPLNAEGIASGISKLIDDKEFAETIKRNTEKRDYSNKHEICKINELIDLLGGS